MTMVRYLEEHSTDVSVTEVGGQAGGFCFIPPAESNRPTPQSCSKFWRFQDYNEIQKWVHRFWRFSVSFFLQWVATRWLKNKVKPKIMSCLVACWLSTRLIWVLTLFLQPNQYQWSPVINIWILASSSIMKLFFKLIFWKRWISLHVSKKSLRYSRLVDVSRKNMWFCFPGEIHHFWCQFGPFISPDFATILQNHVFHTWIHMRALFLVPIFLPWFCRGPCSTICF